MNLTDLQQELRGLEENLARLQNEIEQMKPKEESKIDFVSITKLAKVYQIRGLQFGFAEEFIKKRFISWLSFLVKVEEKGVTERLLYLSRLALGCELEWTAEDIYAEGLKLRIEDFDRLAQDLKDYRYQFLIEGLILAGLIEEGSKELFALVSDIAVLMGCDKNEIKAMAMIAKSKITNQLDYLKELDFFPGKDLVLVARDYIPSEWIEAQRVKVGEICIERNTWESFFFSVYVATKKFPCSIKSQKEKYCFVNRGDKILEYEEEDVLKSITATKEGRVFYSESKEKGKEIVVYNETKNEEDTILHIYIDSVFRVFEKEENG